MLGALAIGLVCLFSSAAAFWQRSCAALAPGSNAKAKEFHAQAARAQRASRHPARDFDTPNSAEQTPAAGGMGKGKWKRRTSDAVLRAAFSTENMAARDVAEQVGRASSLPHGTPVAVRVAQRLERPQPLREALRQPLRQQAVQLHLREVARGRVQDAPGLGHHAVLEAQDRVVEGTVGAVAQQPPGVSPTLCPPCRGRPGRSPPPPRPGQAPSTLQTASCLLHS